MVTAENSRTIEAIRFPLVFLVVLIHASGTQVSYLNGGFSAPEGFYCLFLQHLFSGVLAKTAVPLFSLISGLLFFREGQLTVSLIARKWKNRIRTLLIPFLLWNALVLLGQTVGQSIPPTRAFFSGSTFDVHAVTLYTFADSLLGFDRGPVNFPLWFLRDLIVVTALGPVLLVLLRVTRGWCLVAFALLWIQWVPGKDLATIPSPRTVFFFSLGAWFAGMIGDPLSAVSVRPFLSRAAMSLYAVAACVEAYLLAKGRIVFLLHEANVLLGMYLLWYAANRLLLMKAVGDFLVRLGPSAFFVYLAHGQVVQVFKKLSYWTLQPSRDSTILAIYFLSSLLTALSLSCFYFLLRRHFPRVSAVLTGRDPTLPRATVRRPSCHFHPFEPGLERLESQTVERIA